MVEELADSIGTATNNVAEYQALLAGLELALDHDVQRLDVFLDSELVVRQVNGQYKVKDAGLKPLHQQACLLLSRFREVDVKHVRREQNAEADALVNKAIDAATLTIALARLEGVLLRQGARLTRDGARESRPSRFPPAASGIISARCGCSSVG